MTYTATETYTYTIVDIETVVRRFTADLVMIAQSSGTVTETNAREYAHDVEALAKKGYLKRVDLTLLSGTREIKATQYTVNAAARRPQHEPSGRRVVASRSEWSPAHHPELHGGLWLGSTRSDEVQAED